MRSRMDYTLIKRRLPSGITVYYYCIYDENNRRVYRSTGKRTKAEADRYVRTLRDEGRLGVKDGSKVKLSDYAADFFVKGKCPMERDADARGMTLSRSTMSIRRAALKEHILPHLGKYPVCSITPSLINRWLIALPETDKVTRSTANTYLVALRRVMEQAVKDGLISDNPALKVENLGNDTKRRNAFTTDEVKAIIGREEDWDNPMIRSMCIVAAFTGMRIGEVRAIKPSCVTDDAILIKASFSDKDGYKKPKNGHERIAPITKFVHDELVKWWNEDDDFLFRIYATGKPVSAACVNRCLAERMEKLGIEGKTFHSFRSFCNTQMLAFNINSDIVRAVMGHASEEMTMRYLHMESAEFPAVRKVLDDIGKSILA